MILILTYFVRVVCGQQEEEAYQGVWGWMWCRVQKAWVYIQSCAYDAAMAVVSWLSPSYWMGGGEGEVGGNNLAEAWV